jgi:hypothetical protein
MKATLEDGEVAPVTGCALDFVCHGSDGTCGARCTRLELLDCDVTALALEDGSSDPGGGRCMELRVFFEGWDVASRGHPAEDAVFVDRLMHTHLRDIIVLRGENPSLLRSREWQGSGHVSLLLPLPR